MRKLKLQMQISVDGFAAGPNSEMDWMEWNWDDQLKNYVTGLTGTVDCIILGRKLAEGFIPHWAAVAANPEDPSYSFGKIMHDTPKIVFSNSLKTCNWPNTKLAVKELTAEISELKNLTGKDIVVYGGASFVSSLIKAGLIDEFHLFVNPAAIGKGLSIFGALDKTQKLSLVKSVAFDCGIVVLFYEPK